MGQDFSNQTINLLKIIDRANNRHGDIFWNCICLSCNIPLQISSRQLKNNQKCCKKCRLTKFQNGDNNSSWTGYGEISGNYFASIKNAAKLKNREFSVTIEYIWDLFLKQNRKCKLTGLDLKFNKTVKEIKEKTASLDRIDSTKGYIEGNVQWIHKYVNYVKKDTDNNVFIELSNLISKNNESNIDKEIFLDKINKLKYTWNTKNEFI